MSYERRSNQSLPRPKPLALTDSQVRLVIAGAGGLLPSARTKFIKVLADTLLAETEITDSSVALVIAVVLAKFNFDDAA